MGRDLLNGDLIIAVHLELGCTFWAICLNLRSKYPKLHQKFANVITEFRLFGNFFRQNIRCALECFFGSFYAFDFGNIFSCFLGKGLLRMI